MRRILCIGFLALGMAGCATQAVDDAKFEQQTDRIAQLASMADKAGLDIQFNFWLDDTAEVYLKQSAGASGPLKVTGSMKADFARPSVPGND